MTKNRIYLFLLTVTLGVAFCAAVATRASAQTLTTLASFDLPGGIQPSAGLVQGFDGNLYGTTNGGGTNYDGAVFRVTLDGTITTLYSFDSLDGSDPTAPLVQAADGSFYGTTVTGGRGTCSGLCGTVFNITAEGTLTTLHDFGGGDGAYPSSGALVQGTDGNFYGTTGSGGAYDNGAIFKMTSTGRLKTIYSFCPRSPCADGFTPAGGLVQGTDGDFYGTTSSGGASIYGTVFKITSNGKLTTLHSFDASGYGPAAGLVQAADGSFYGTTENGGLGLCGGGCGTVFKISSAGGLVSHRFNGANGAFPSTAVLIQATDGNLYGVTPRGGSGTCRDDSGLGCGTIFQLTPGGVLTTLYSFCVQANCPDGSQPVGGLVQATNGLLYGTTRDDGAFSGGTVFSLSLGLGPFVKTLTTSGDVGATVIILGTNLAGATGVTFNGTTADFTVVSSSEITATVPSGATSGLVSVTTPGGVLNSNQPFQVKP